MRKLYSLILSISSNQIRRCRFYVFLLICVIPKNNFAQHGVTTLAGTSVQFSPFGGPSGICITPDGSTLYVVDYYSHTIKKIIVQTVAVRKYAGKGVAGNLDGEFA